MASKFQSMLSDAIVAMTAVVARKKAKIGLKESATSTDVARTAPLKIAPKS